MFRKRKHQVADESLDRAAKSIVRAGGLSEEDAEAVSSRLSYARLRAHIAAERKPSAGLAESWFATFLALRQAIPAMAMIAIIAAGMLWLANAGTPASSLDPVFTGGGNPGVERVAAGGTCAISSSDECVISTDDVLATIVSRGQQEAQ